MAPGTHRVANVVIGATAVGALVPLAALVWSLVGSLLSVMKLVAITVIAGFIDTFLLRFQ